MRSAIFYICSVASVAMGSIIGTPQSDAPIIVRMKKDVHPVVKKLCASCHRGKLAAANFDIEKLLANDPKRNVASWRKVLQRISTQTMPPSSSPQPTLSQRNGIVQTLGDFIGDEECRIAEPGRVTVRRLNRAEYNNTVRDLLGIELDLSEDFPSDDVGHGFDNIGDVLSVSPLLVEKYLDAAERAATAAIADNRPRTVRMDPASMGDSEGQRLTDNGSRILYASSEVGGEFNIPTDGTYRIRVQAWGQQAGPEVCKMALRVEARRLETFDVSAVEGNPAIYESAIQMKRGTKRISAAFLNDYYRPEVPNPRDRDRNLAVDWIELVGPIDSSPPLPASHRRLIPNAPIQGQEREYARELIKKFACRAYRRPPTTAEIDRLLSCYDLAAKEKESFERGMQLAVTGALVSPQFLFRIESQKAGYLDGYEMASRLSYFLWSSMPDDTLLNAAQRGDLAKPAALQAQVARMLADPKAKALAENFASQWLQLRKLALISPDPTIYPEFNESLRNSMRNETLALFNYIVSADRPVTEFLDAKYSFIDKPLAKLYGLDASKFGTMQRVDLSSIKRQGLLSHASFLAVTSNPNRTSPVKRGKWILENILGTPPPPPPPGVGDLAEAGENISGLSLKKRMEQHRKDPSCASCHSRMDALGIALESYDAIGKKLATPQDDKAQLPNGKTLDGMDGLRAMILADKQQFVRCLSEKLLTYALGRGLTSADDCAIEEIVKHTRKNQLRFSALVTAIVTNDVFRKIGK